MYYKKNDSEYVSMQGHFDKKEEKNASSNVRDSHLGVSAYAAIPEISEKDKIELEKKERLDFQNLYPNQRRITTFPKSPGTVLVKLPSDFKTVEQLRAELVKLWQINKDDKRATELVEIFRKSQLNSGFQIQFDKLIGDITAWCVQNEKVADVKLDTAIVVSSLEFFRNNLFTDTFAGMQDSLYFEELKYLLERFYLYYLLDKSIPHIEKIKKLNGLAPHLIVCGPGAHAHLQEDMNLHAGVFSIEKSLAGFRTQIIKNLASNYVFERISTPFPVHEGNEIHVPISYFKLAKDLGLNPDWKEPKDPHHELTLLDEKNVEDFFTNPENRFRKKFENDFKAEFNYKNITTDILDRLISTIYEAIKAEIIIFNNAARKKNKENQEKFRNQENVKLTIIPELKIDGQFWPINNQEILRILKSILASAGIELDGEFLEYKNNTHATFIRDVLRNHLMVALMKKGVFVDGMLFNGEIYFYADYIPQVTPLEFVEKIHKTGRVENARLEPPIPEEVKDEMMLRLDTLEMEGIRLLKAHRALKQMLPLDDVKKIADLMKVPGIDLNYKLDNKESLWECAVFKYGNVEACGLFLDTQTISQSSINQAFLIHSGLAHLSMCGVFLQKDIVSTETIDTVIEKSFLDDVKSVLSPMFSMILTHVIKKGDDKQIINLMRSPKFDPHAKLDSKESLWEYSLKCENLKACGLFIDAKKISQSVLDEVFLQKFKNNNFKICDFLVQKNAVSKELLVKIISELQFDNQAGWQFLLNKKIIRYPLISPSQEKTLQELVQHVLYGNKDKVRQILDENPKLVFYKGLAKDYSNRTISGSPYQMALGGGDVNRVKLDKDNKPVIDEKGNLEICHADEGMAEMIKSYFITASGNDEKFANEEIQQQQEEQFPGGIDAYEDSPAVKAKKQNDLNALKEVIEAVRVTHVKIVNTRVPELKDKELHFWSGIDNDVMADAKCEAALSQLRKCLESNEVIKHGMHFNIELLVAAFNLYFDQERFNNFGGTYSAKNVFIWNKVLGAILEYVPANYAQVLCFGLKDIIIGDQKVARSLAVRFLPWTHYFRDGNPIHTVFTVVDRRDREIAACITKLALSKKYGLALAAAPLLIKEGAKQNHIIPTIPKGLSLRT